MSDVELKMGGLLIQPSNQTVKRMTMLIWGGPGGGKTTLACTAPGKKLLVNFDPDGPASVAGWPDVDVVDFSSVSPYTLEQAKNSNNPLGLASVIDNYDTIVFDSLTNIGYKTLMHGVGTTKNATVERPGLQAYGVRNALILQLVKNTLALTNKFNKHCIFIAHEAPPTTNDDGVVLYITLALGGQLPDQAALDFSEVWNVADMGAGRNRRIMIRPARNKKPCKTRMFQTSGEPEFEWSFDPDDLEDTNNMTIAGWFEAWKANGMKKLELPKLKKK